MPISNPMSEEPKVKLNPSLKDKYKSSKKGQVYLFLVNANEIAFRNHYEKQKTDIGAKPAIWLDEKFNSITKPSEGPYWQDDYAGFDRILEKAREAKHSIVSGEYDESVSSFLDSVLMSHIPKIDEVAQRGKSSTLPVKRLIAIAELRHPEKVLAKGVTGADIRKNKLKEDTLTEDLASLSELESALYEDEGEEDEPDYNDVPLTEVNPNYSDLANQL